MKNRRKSILIALFSPLIQCRVLQAPVLIPESTLLLNLLTDLSIRGSILILNEMILSGNIAKSPVILLTNVLNFMVSHLSSSSPKVNRSLHALKWRLLPILLPHLILLRLIHLHMVFLRNNMIISWSSSIMFRSLRQSRTILTGLCKFCRLALSSC